MTASLNVRLRNKDGGAADSHRISVTEHYDRWWQEFGSPDLRKVYENFGMELFRRSSCLDGFNAFVARTGFRGKRCVEIGTCHGLTAAVLSRYFDEVISIDIQPKPVKHEVIEFLGIKNVRFHDVKDNTEKFDLIHHAKFDAAYSDGDHTKDTKLDFDAVKKGGRVMFHECWPLQPHVWELVNGLRATGTVHSHGTYALWTANGA